MVRPPITALLLLLLLTPGSGLAEGAFAEPTADPAQVWIDWTRPPAGAREIGPSPLLAIEGWAVAGSARARDVVLAIDVSASTLGPSGSDIDGDGRTGRRLRSADDPLRTPNPQRRCTDPGDTIRAAEIEAARRFVDSLDEDRSRLALVTFADRAEIRSGLSSDPDVWRAAVEDLAQGAAFGGSATDLGAALETSLSVFGAEHHPPGRERWIVMVSDGVSQTAGSAARARRHAVAIASAATEHGVRVHAIALGGDAGGPDSLYAELAARTGGRFEALASPAEVVQRLAALDLSGVAAIRIENRSSGEAGRAVRVSANGRFDGVVALVPGQNRIRVVATGEDGQAEESERLVEYLPRAPENPTERRAVAAKLAWLRDRTRLLELEAEIFRGRSPGVEPTLHVGAEVPIDVAAPPPGDL